MVARKSSSPITEAPPPEVQPWGAFSTDTATGVAPADAEQAVASEPVESGGTISPPQPWPDDPQQMSPEDTEAAKVKKSRRKVAEAKAPKVEGDNSGMNATKLVKLVERMERLMEEIATSKQDLKEIFVEAKVEGYKPAIIRKVLSRRAMDDDKRKELDEQIALYEEALR